ncbi:unnamed protein product [Phytophthora fragariaefolia]|uniref:Unnamed protein product n=1 Tax=Phytophthora fragariaefolia TaxID=1490495 RepID=A0A9W6U2Y4_9STRA|nr:unnamed protein product [Phytophthora fragariaefolia]
MSYCRCPEAPMVGDFACDADSTAAISHTLDDQEHKQTRYNSFINTLKKTHAANVATVARHWETQARKFCVELPSMSHTTTDVIDDQQVRLWSELANRGKLSLPGKVQICRGQKSDDTRPIKDLYELPQPAHPDG